MKNLFDLKYSTGSSSFIRDCIRFLDVFKRLTNAQMTDYDPAFRISMVAS
jgi:hypothetical protein